MSPNQVYLDAKLVFFCHRITRPSGSQQTCLLPGTGRGGKVPAFQSLCVPGVLCLFWPSLQEGRGEGTSRSVNTDRGGFETNRWQSEVYGQRHALAQKLRSTFGPGHRRQKNRNKGHRVLLCNHRLYSSCQSPNATQTTHFFFSKVGHSRQKKNFQGNEDGRELLQNSWRHSNGSKGSKLILS